MSDNVTKRVDEKFCWSCGYIIKMVAEICPKCGVRQKEPSEKRKTTVLLLCFFLGILGIHRFYVGKIGTGILQFLTFGILGMWTIIDFILIATDNFTDKEGRKIHNWNDVSNIETYMN